jgi:hypothetical protein
MKIIKYNLCTRVNHGTEEKPALEDVLSLVTMGWNDVNEEIAKREAYNGEYIIVEVPDVEPDTLTQEDRIKELEDALALLLSGATE